VLDVLFRWLKASPAIFDQKNLKKFVPAVNFLYFWTLVIKTLDMELDPDPNMDPDTRLEKMLDPDPHFRL
jgi:hypothetical protein